VVAEFEKRKKQKTKKGGYTQKTKGGVLITVCLVLMWISLWGLFNVAQLCKKAENFVLPEPVVEEVFLPKKHYVISFSTFEKLPPALLVDKNKMNIKELSNSQDYFVVSYKAVLSNKDNLYRFKTISVHYYWENSEIPIFKRGHWIKTYDPKNRSDLSDKVLWTMNLDTKVGKITYIPNGYFQMTMIIGVLGICALVFAVIFLLFSVFKLYIKYFLPKPQQE